MFAAFDQILIDVQDLSQAISEYNQLLGPLTVDDDRALLPLGNVHLSIGQDSTLDEARITGLKLLDEALPRGQSQPIDSGNRKLNLARSHSRHAQYNDTPGETGIYAVDHIVLQSNDADDCIRLFGDELGLRLALDQQVPEWGGRMLFFRMGKMTLEIIHNLEKPPEQDFFWGITYLCQDIEQTVAALDTRGVAHSPIREGRKPGTRVATIKSHCLGLPTLLVGPA